MVSSSSWQLAVKASLVLFAGLTTAKPVSNWPTLLGRQDAGATTSADVAGSATTTAASATQSGSETGGQVAENLLGLISPDGWCDNLDMDDPDEMIRRWEDKGVAIVMDFYTNGQGDGWLERLVNYALPGKGDPGSDGCGVIGGTCDMGLECPVMAAQLLGAEYWVLRAVERYHQKIQIAHEFLQDTTIDNILWLGEIAADFTADDTTDGMGELALVASLLSAGIFLGGGVAGAVATVATSTQRAAAAAKVTAEKASRQAMVRQNIPEVNKQDALAEAARIVEERNGGISRQSNALGSGLWLTASSFTAVGAFADAEGSVEAEDLESTLKSMFSAARQQLVSQASLVMGRGGDYSALTGADGNGQGPTFDETSYIARHFSDGKFLLSESSPVFNESIQDSYGTFRSKIVDQALQTGGFQVFALTDKEEKDCDMYGAQWMDPLDNGEMYCLQLHRDNFGNGCDTADTCDWVPATNADFDMLQNKYGFNMAEYYSAAVGCNKSGLESRIPDFVTMLWDQVTPACYYSIIAQKAKTEKTCALSGLSCSTKMRFSDF